MTFLRTFVENNVSLVLFAAMAIGFIIPGLDQTPGWVVIALLSTNMFFSCAKITTEDIQGIRASTSFWFAVVRYFVLPVAVFFALQPINFSVATAALLLTLAPSGLTAPTVTNLVKGNIAFSILMTVITHLMFPIIAPIYLYTLVGQHTPINVMSLFINLLIMVVVPVLAFGLVKWLQPKIAERAKTYATTSAVLLISTVIIILVGQLRHHILDNLQQTCFGFLWIIPIYAFNYLIGGMGFGMETTPRNSPRYDIILRRKQSGPCFGGRCSVSAAGRAITYDRWTNRLDHWHPRFPQLYRVAGTKKPLILTHFVLLTPAPNPLYPFP